MVTHGLPNGLVGLVLSRLLRTSTVAVVSAGLVGRKPARSRRSGATCQHEQPLLVDNEYSDRVKAIIQRDYFPDLHQSQNKSAHAEMFDGASRQLSWLYAYILAVVTHWSINKSEVNLPSLSNVH